MTRQNLLQGGYRISAEGLGNIVDKAMKLYVICFVDGNWIEQTIFILNKSKLLLLEIFQI